MAQLSNYLSRIQGPVGVSSAIHGLLSGDRSGLDRESPVSASLDEARQRLEAVRAAQRDCKSDYAYWGYEGEAAAWQCAVHILEAAELVGPDELPDVHYAPGGGVVMDECSKLTRWGRDVLASAQSLSKADGDQP